MRHLFVTAGLVFFSGYFLVRTRVTVSVSSRIIGKRTLYDLYCPHCSLEMMVTFTRGAGHFENGMHVITCISGHTRPLIFAETI